MVEAFLAEFREMQYPWAVSGGQIYSVFGIGVRNRKYADTPIR